QWLACSIRLGIRLVRKRMVARIGGCAGGQKTRSGSPLDTIRTASQGRPENSELELVFDLQVDLAAFDRTCEQDAARTGRIAGDAGVAFGQADLVREVRALQTELPVLLVVRDD